MIEIWATSRTYRQSRKYPYVWHSLQHRKPTFWQAHATLSLPTWTLRSGILTINNWIVWRPPCSKSERDVEAR